ncbi:Uncharacterised protein [Vibrio cholerae]|nr:Uncharacterised protein [Vibrio cholerae]
MEVNFQKLSPHRLHLLFYFGTNVKRTDDSA